MILRRLLFSYLKLVFIVFKINANKDIILFDNINNVHFNWTHLLVNHIVKEVRPHQVIIVNSAKVIDLPIYQHMINNILPSIPTEVLSERLREEPENFYILRPAHKYPRNAVLYVLVFRGTTHHDNEIVHDYVSRRLIDITNIISHSIRPKCLFIYINDCKICNMNFSALMQKAWDKPLYFLDFTIIEIRVWERHYDPIIHYYNPFYNVHHKSIFNATTELAFPNKLQNLNGIELSFGVHLDEITDEDVPGKPITKNYPFIGILKEKMNFIITEKFKVKSRDSISKLVATLGNQTSLSKFNMYFSKRINFIRKWLGTGLLNPFFHVNNNCEKMVAVIPIRRNVHFLTSYIILVYTCSVVIFLSISVCILKLIKYNNKFWRSYNILQLFLRMPIQTSPKNLLQKVFFLYFSSVLIGYSAFLYSKIMNYSFSYLGRETLNSLEKMSKSRMSATVGQFMYDYVFEHNANQYVKAMAATASKADNAKECLEFLRHEKANVICIVPDYIARNYMSEIYSKYNKTVPIKVTDVVFVCEDLPLLLERGSPYTEQFQRVVNKIFQAGLLKFWNNSEDHMQYFPEEFMHEATFKDEVLRKSLLLVLMAGFLLSFFVLMCEMLYDYYVYLYLDN